MIVNAKTWCVVFGLFLFLPPVQAGLVTVTFDDLEETGFTPVGSFIPDGYVGLNWHDFGVIDPMSLGEPFETSGYTNGIVSGSHVGYSVDAGSTISFSGGAFDFESAYLTAAWKNNVRVLITGYDAQKTAIYQDILFIDSDTTLLHTFNYVGINSLEIRSTGGVDAGYGGFGSNVVYDNVTFSTPSVTVPEPISLSLFRIGILSLICFGVTRRLQQTT